MSRSKIIALIIVAAILPGTSHAARVWLFQNVFIEDVIYANAGGNSAVRIILSDTSQPIQAYNCAPTSQGRVVSHWDSPTNLYMTNLTSMALSAQAQGLPVDIMVETSDCSSAGSSWENDGNSPNGLGLKLQGIRVRGQ